MFYIILDIWYDKQKPKESKYQKSFWDFRSLDFWLEYQKSKSFWTFRTLDFFRKTLTSKYSKSQISF